MDFELPEELILLKQTLVHLGRWLIAVGFTV